MRDIALHLDSTRARAAGVGPSGFMVPIPGAMAFSSMPLVVAEGSRGELLTGRQGFLLSLEEPGRARRPFLPMVGALGHRGEETDPSAFLARALEPMKRIWTRDASLALAVPAYLDDMAVTAAARAVESTGWKVRIAAPSALAAWCAVRELAGTPSGIVCECDEHALSLSLVEESAGWARRRLVRVLRHLALPAWRRAVVAGLADATVRYCRRDPRADPGLDAVLARQGAAWVDEEAPPPRTATLELGGSGWNATLVVEPRQVGEWCAPLLGSLRSAVMEMQAAAGPDGPAKALVLASTARVPGIASLAESVHENWVGPLHPDAPLQAQLAWLGSVGRGEAFPGLWREAPVSELVGPKAGRGAP